MKNVLFLGSESFSRQQLLKEADIPFVTIGHSADETSCDWGLPFPELLKSIALEKMKHVILPQGQENRLCFVLTADTLGKDKEGVVHGKPVDRADAVNKIKALRAGGIVATAVCVDKNVWVNGQWQPVDRILQYVEASYEFDMPDGWIDRYLDAVPRYKEISGAITIEGFGAQFLKSINGSYSTILGLPMFEVRIALEKINFFQIIN